VGAILLRPLAGRLGDRQHRRVLMVGGALVVAITAASAGLVESLGWLIATRVVMGFGEACFFVGGTTMATDLAPVARRGEAVSYWSVAVWTGLGFGPVVGETLLDGAHYDRVWWVAGASALIAALVAFTTTETRVVHEHAERGRLIAPAAVRPGIILACTLIGITGFSIFLPLYGPEVGVDDVGLVFLLYGIVVLAVRILGARLPDVLGPVLAGSIAIGSTAAGLAIAALWHSGAGVFVAALVIAVGSSFLYPAALLLTLRGVAEHQRASVVGTLSAFFDFASGSSGLILGVIAAISSYQGAFGMSAILAAFAFVLLRSGFAGHAEGVVPTVAEVAPATADPTTLS
jgi:MFS family permease